MKKIFLLLFLMTISLGQSQNSILNGTFAAGAANWNLGSPGVVTAGELSIPSSSAAAPFYTTEMYQAGMTLTSSAVYTLTFRARATTARNISVSIQHRGSWQDSFRNDAVALTTTMTTYSYSFTCNPAGNAGNNQLNFHLGGFGSPANTYGVFIDDVAIVPGNVVATPCANGIQDVALGETGVDCGGSCGACLITPTFNAFTAGSKLVGDADFTVTATSDSPGAITYTSATPGVATVNSTSGLVHIVSAGTTVITATQAATSSYYAASTTSTLTVSYPPPASAAPTPPARNAWDVVSLYSGAYTATTGATWGAAGADVSLSGDNARFFNGFTLSRLSFGAVNLTTAGMTTLHIDVYTANQNQLWFELQGNRKVVSSIALNGWVSFDIPLTDYVGLNLTNISFFDLNNPTGAAAPTKVVYLDNIYFYRAATSAPPTIGTLTIPAKLLGDADFAITAPSSNSAGAFTYTSSNTAVATIVNGNEIHVVGMGSSTITATQAADGSYASGTKTATLTVTGPAPTVAAPIPPARNTWDVVSVYSGSYTPVAGTRNYNPNWGGTSGNGNFAQPSPAGDGNQVLKYVGVGYQGIDIGSTINATSTGMTHLHVDIWTTNQPSTDFRIIDGADRSKILATAGGQWNSFDIPLTDFAGLNKANIIQFKFQPNPFTGTGEWYFDNIYFWRAQTTPPPTLGTLTVAAKLTTDAPFTLTAPTSNTAGAWSYTSSNTAVATISGSTVTIKGNGTSIITATQAADGGYSSGSVTANLVVTYPGPTVAAPTPTVPSGNVISLFSNAYTNQSGTDFAPSWGGQPTVVSDVTIAGNATKKYTSLNYQGTQYTTIDASTQHSIHFDLWSPNCTAIKITLINTSAVERSVVVPTTPLNTWKSVDLLMSQFSSQGLNLTNLYQFKIENWTNGSQTTGGELYYDNIYFSNVVTNVAPIISGFTIPVKLVGDASFNLTAPTSSSAGAFTYTSSNAKVATISGSTVTVIGAGTSVITATQAANGSYTSGSITANLVVSGGPTSAAPVPNKPEQQTKSVFSNSYPNITTTTYDYYGGSSVASVISVANNSTMSIKNLGRTGINLAGGVDVSNMKTLHLDVFTPNVTKFNVILFNVSAQSLFPVTTTVNGWNSIDITLTGQTNVTQILLVASPDAINTIASTITNGVAYVDNIYFWTDVTNLSALSSQFRGKTVFDINSTLSAVTNSGATTYRYEITNKTTNAVSTLDLSSTTRTSFNLTQFQTSPATNPQAITYGTTYAVRVAVNNGSFVYGSSYNVSTPANVISTKVVNKQCGVTLTKLDEPIYADQVYSANKFRFLVNGGSIVNQEFTSSLPSFNLTQLGAISYGTSYSIRVKASNDGGATWPTAYGATCSVTTPGTAPLALIMSPKCGITLPALNSVLYATPVYGANLYRFEVSGGVFVSRDLITASTAIRLTSLLGGAENATTYTIRVASSSDNGISWGDYGPACSFTTPAAPIARMSNSTLNNAFEVKAFPNPFATNFQLNIESSSDDVIDMKVFDMIGRQLEAKKATVSELSSQQIGTNYPSGIYNIVVSQGENVKSIRMIKR